MADESGSEEYFELIKEQLENEEKRRNSIEQRGAAVITSSGALATLLFGFAALSRRTVPNQVVELPPGVARELRPALTSFVIAALLAILTNLLLFYSAATPDGLQSMVKAKWNDSKSIASQRASATRIKILRRARLMNSIKGYSLLAAMTAEVVAVWYVARAVGVFLR